MGNDFREMADLQMQNHSNETKAIEAIVQNLITRHILTEEEAAKWSLIQKIIGFFDSEIRKRAYSAKLFKRSLL